LSVLATKIEMLTRAQEQLQAFLDGLILSKASRGSEEDEGSDYSEGDPRRIYDGVPLTEHGDEARREDSPEAGPSGE